MNKHNKLTTNIIHLFIVSVLAISFIAGCGEEKGRRGRANEQKIKHYYCPFCDEFQGTWLDFGGRTGVGLYGVEDQGPQTFPTFPSSCSDCGKEFGTSEMYEEFKY